MKVVQKDETKVVDPLDAIAASATAAHEPVPGTPGPDGEVDQPEKPKLTNEQCLMMGLGIIRDTLCSFAKVSTPKATMQDDTLQPVAEAWGAVLDKYGIDLSTAAGDYMTEIKAAVVTVPVVLAIRGGLMTELAEAKKQKNIAAPADAAPVAITPAPAAAPAGPLIAQPA